MRWNIVQRSIWKSIAPLGVGLLIVFIVPTQVVAALGAPTPASPANGAFVQNTSVTLSWSSSLTLACYDLRLYTANPDTNPGALSIPLPNPICSKSYTATSLTDGANYWWRVRAVAKYGSSAFSSTQMFSVDSSAPQLTADNQTTTNTKPIITGTTNDPSAHLSITIDNTTYPATISQTPNNSVYPWQAPVLSPLNIGAYTVHATATDTAGNTSTTEAKLTITQPTSNNGANADTPTRATNTVTSSASAPQTTSGSGQVATTSPTASTSSADLTNNAGEQTSPTDTTSSDQPQVLGAKTIVSSRSKATFLFLLFIPLALAIVATWLIRRARSLPTAADSTNPAQDTKTDTDPTESDSTPPEPTNPENESADTEQTKPDTQDQEPTGDKQ